MTSAWEITWPQNADDVGGLVGQEPVEVHEVAGQHHAAAAAPLSAVDTHHLIPSSST